MRRLMALFAVAVLSTIMLSSGTIAQTNPETGDDVVNQQTQNEVRAMATQNGAKVRLMQLEKSMQRNLLMGQKIIDEIEERNESFDTSELESILDELALLIEEVNATDPEGDTQDVVKSFVDLKNDALELSKRFRDIARSAFGEEELDAMRERMRESIQDSLKEIMDRIRNQIREHNAEIVRRALQNMNRIQEEFVNMVNQGNVTIENIKERIGNALGQMNATERRAAIAEMSQDLSQRSATAAAAIERARQRYLENREARIQERIERFNETEARIQSYLNARLNASRMGGVAA